MCLNFYCDCWRGPGDAKCTQELMNCQSYLTIWRRWGRGRVLPTIDYCTIQGGEAIILLASCTVNWTKVWLCVPLDLLVILGCCEFFRKHFGRPWMRIRLSLRRWGYRTAQWYWRLWRRPRTRYWWRERTCLISGENDPAPTDTRERCVSCLPSIC